MVLLLPVALCDNSLLLGVVLFALQTLCGIAHVSGQRCNMFAHPIASNAEGDAIRMIAVQDEAIPAPLPMLSAARSASVYPQPSGFKA